MIVAARRAECPIQDSDQGERSGRHPATEFEFSKGYYARVTSKLYGRVTRLFYTPLIRSLRRILGQNLFLSYLATFATPCPENLR